MKGKAKTSTRRTFKKVLIRDEVLNFFKKSKPKSANDSSGNLKDAASKDGSTQKEDPEKNKLNLIEPKLTQHGEIPALCFGYRF